MTSHQAWTTVDVAPNVLFDRLSDLDHLPDYLPWLTSLRRTEAMPVEAQGPEARRPHQAVRRYVETHRPTGHHRRHGRRSRTRTVPGRHQDVVRTAHADGTVVIL